MNIIKFIAGKHQVKEQQVEKTIELLDSGNTVPFIARYRKEATGGLTDEQIFSIQEDLQYLRQLNKRREEILRIIEERGKLTPELKEKLTKADTLQMLEDLYLPYKEKRRTLATIAKEKGLEPLAITIWSQETNTAPLTLATQYINAEHEIESAEQALEGATNIIGEIINETAVYRQVVRSLTRGYGSLVTNIPKKIDAGVYDMYTDFEQSISDLPPHRILAINRGVKEKIIKSKIAAPTESILKRLERDIIKTNYEPIKVYLQEVIAMSYKKYLAPAIEREISRQLTELAEKQATLSFQTNLRQLLMQPPVKGITIMGLDPAYRTGCKLCVIDNTGKLLKFDTIYPHQPQNRWQQSQDSIKKYVKEFEVTLIVIGNGTASRETEKLVAELTSTELKETSYVIVDEAGASVYSASPLARKEFPELDVAMRGSVSIARRILDPLAELVKIDPKSIGVGMYQHDVNQKNLSKALEQTVTSCVNQVGIDLNTASASLLSYISGINKTIATNIVAYRDENGVFTSRKELNKVAKLGKKTFEQCAGFLRIRGSNEYLDNTGIHPESYKLTYSLLSELGIGKKQLEKKSVDLQELLKDTNTVELAKTLDAGIPTIKDIIDDLRKPGHDPRDELPKPIFSTDVISMEMLREGMIMTGTVRNVIDFGAFVDIGVKQDGLIHISQLSHSYVRHPSDIVKVGDIVKVKIIDLDLKRKRISLSMKL
ncbi:RNA-binding transcriptional accessory protein [Clostridium sp. 'deep sea']|uniref:Tex family protein n=1 Tax=Clostridium sp. 'deep sea' TaxID=2779445 RepID=UPI00189655D2|nr:Tex family protein [Clostridium sp. 'deep sea']QOR35965.1 RNA-binding transcriptional accessory protein [Clostridium sp. 'deep sea']